MSMVDRKCFDKMLRLFEESEADLRDYENLMEELWRETKDPRIEALWRKGGGIMIDEKFMFHDKF